MTQNASQFSKKIKITVADCVTLAGLISSVIATLFIFENKFLIGYFFILGQIIADLLDGRIARSRKEESNLGMFLDSFSDFYTIAVTAFMGLMMGMGNMLTLIIIPVFIASAALRLGLFMARGGVKDGYFRGIPTTAISCGIPLLLILNYYFWNLDINYALILYAASAIFMPSKIKIKKI